MSDPSRIVIEIFRNPDGTVHVTSSMTFAQMRERFLGKDPTFSPVEAYAMEMLIAAAGMNDRTKARRGLTRVPLILPPNFS